MSDDNLFIGIDSGTQGTKAIVLSQRTGKVIVQAHSGYGLVENTRGGREQHPSLWVDACRVVLREVLAHPEVKPGDVSGIGVSGQQHGLVALDSSGAVIRPAKLWCDTETTAECAELMASLGGESEVLKETGNLVAAGFTASKLLWLKKNEPHNYERIATVFLPHDYINYWLTGEYAVEFGDASGTAYFDVKRRQWSEKVLRALDGSGKLFECLPSFVAASGVCGRVRKEHATEFGFRDDLIVSAGGGDNMMAAIGTGNVVPGVVTASLGTSGTIFAYSDSPVVDDEGELAAFCSSSGGWLPLVCTMNVTVATETTRKLFGYDLQQMNDAVRLTEPGSGGLTLLPYFQGERTPDLPAATATLSGMTCTNYTRSNVARAAMEGATFGLRYGLGVMVRNGIVPEEIRLVGGGAKSSVWRQMVADVFNCRVVSLENEEAAALGGALQAMWAWRNSKGESMLLSELTDIHVHTVAEKECLPEPKLVSFYDDKYGHYLELNERVYR